MVAAVWWALFAGRDHDLSEASWDRGRQRHALRACLAAALLVLLAGEFGRGYLRDHGGPLFAVMVAAHAAPVLLVNWRPLTAWRLAVAGTVATAVVATALGAADPWTPVMLSYAPVLTIVVARSMIVQAAALAGVSLIVTAATGSLTAVGVVMVAVGAGGVLGRSARIEQRLDLVSRSMAEERTRRAVLEERSRIAGELHDVLAHHLSLLVIRTESAPLRLEAVRATGPGDPLRAEFTALGAATRQALDETRRLLDVLPDEAALTPQPTLEQIPELVAEARRNGMPVQLTVTGEPPEHVHATVGLVGYRVVQEALSNAGRHAPGARVDVRIAYADQWVHLDVGNEAPAQPPADRDPGRGLQGMRERVDVVRGLLQAGPRSGGFRVSAALPLNGGIQQ